ncbi:MAG: dienelactone hydrolase family protein [Acidobacteriota bacterium]
MTRTIFLAHVLSLIVVAAWAGTDTDDYLERMNKEHTGDTPVASPATEVEPGANVTSRDVDYVEIEGSKVSGYLSTPTEGAPVAGIILIHEWWGLNDNIRAMARRFAGEGYAALAVDLYEGEVAETRDDAMRLATGVRERIAAVEENLRGAHDYLSDTLGIDRIGVIGWCFGGGWSLRTALILGDEIDATVIYYGRLVTDRSKLEPLSSPVLGIFGALDEGIPVTTVREFQTVLDSLGKPVSIHIYEGAGHAFANPSGTRYNQNAAEDAWGKTLNFFAQTLR